jgi:hypothetical protein
MVYESDLIRMELHDDLVVAEYKPNVYIELEQAVNIVYERNKLAGDRPHFVLVKGGPITIAANAKKYALSKASAKNIIAWAVLDKQNMLKTTFIRILFFTQGKGNCMRFFTDEQEAITWLNKKREKVPFTMRNN